MKKTKQFLSALICLILIISTAFFCNGCKKESENDNETTTQANSVDISVIGSGKTVFYFTAVDEIGNETKWEVHTDKETVGEALTDEKLIFGEDGPYGLYVKTVNGITLSYEESGYYWAFYEGDDYALKGVELTEIEDGKEYSFRAQK